MGRGMSAKGQGQVGIFKSNKLDNTHHEPGIR